MRCFVWILSHDRLLTGERMQQFGIGNMSCFCCGCYNKDTLHVLRDCSHVRTFWESYIPMSLAQHFFHCNLQEWIDLNLDQAAKTGGRMIGVITGPLLAMRYGSGIIKSNMMITLLYLMTCMV